MSDFKPVSLAADRHGIVTRSNGLINPNHYLAAAISYLYRHRPDWSSSCAVGKTHGQQRHHRPRCREARPGASSSKCPLGSSGSSTVSSTARSASPARRVPSVVPPAGRIGLDHGQGRDNSRSACRRNHRTNQAGPEAKHTIASRASWASPSTRRSTCPRHPNRKRAAEGALAQSDRHDGTCRRANTREAYRRSGQRTSVRWK